MKNLRQEYGTSGENILAEYSKNPEEFSKVIKEKIKAKEITPRQLNELKVAIEQIQKDLRFEEIG